jgi:hypothetical protein
MIDFIKKIFGSQKNDVALINDPNEIITETITADIESTTFNKEADSDEVNVNAETIDSNTSIPIIFNDECLSIEFSSTNPAQFLAKKFRFYSWQVKEGEWVEEGTPIYQICNSVNYNMINGQFIATTYKHNDEIFATKSGIIEYCKKSGEDIKNGDIVGYIHPVGGFKNENLITNNTYYYYFNINKFITHDDFPHGFLYDFNGLLLLRYSKFNINRFEWKKNDNEFVKNGDLIFTFEYTTNIYGETVKNGIRHHYAEKDGFIDINKNGSNVYYDLNRIAYKINIEHNEILNKFKNEPQIQVDEFNDSVKINWNIVGGYVNHYETQTNATIGGVILNTDDGKNFIFSFESYDNKDYLVFYYSVKDYKLAVGDKVSFLFEDNLKHTFTIIEKSNRSKIVAAKLYETKVQITKNELQIFSDKNLLKWKIENTINNTSIISDAKNFYWYTNELLQIVIKNLAIDYLDLVSKYVVNHVPLTERTLSENINGYCVEECYVYLMIDTTNNFHKIGISNNPKYREKTLQSDKPTIELLHKKSFPNRKIAEILEKTLHQTYANKRIRGEWFELDSYEINEIIVLLD